MPRYGEQSDGSSFSESLRLSEDTSGSYSLRNAAVGEGASSGEPSEDSGELERRRRVLAAALVTSQGANASSASMSGTGQTMMATNDAVAEGGVPPTGGAAALPTTQVQVSTASGVLSTESAAERGRTEVFGIDSPEASHRGPSGSSDKLESCWTDGMQAALNKASASLRRTSPYPTKARTPTGTRPPPAG